MLCHNMESVIITAIFARKKMAHRSGQWAGDKCARIWVNVDLSSAIHGRKSAGKCAKKTLLEKRAGKACRFLLNSFLYQLINCHYTDY